MATVAITVYMLCFFAILVVNPLNLWSDFASYVAQQRLGNQMFKYVAQATMLLFPLLYLLMVNSMHDQALASQQVLTRVALMMAVAFAVLVGTHYWVQISAVRLNLNKGTTDGLVQFIQAKPDSAMAAINLLGWTMFFGLSQLFMAPVFAGARLERAIRFVLIIGGVNCLIGSVGYLLDNVLVVGLTMNLIMGGCMIALSLLLLAFFRRKGQEHKHVASLAHNLT